MKRKPIIGITCNYDENDEIGIITDMGVPLQKWQFLADNYINFVERIGGIPIIIPICEHFNTVEGLLDTLDGVIITGGNDISPDCYGEETTEKCGALVSQRDKQDIQIITSLLNSTRIPVLGICRGMQAMNVAAGGTLYQDLCAAGFNRHSIDESPMYQPVHTVNLKEVSKIHCIFGCKTLPVNSYHHSAIKQLAGCYMAAGESEDHVLEAIELPDHPFFLAVQWHPEMMYREAIQQNLFRSFKNACKNK